MSMTTTNNNAVVTATPFTKPDPVKADNQITDIPSQARKTWLNGTHSRSTISSFHGHGHEMAHLSSAGEGYVDRSAIPGPSDCSGRIGYQGVKVIFDIKGYSDDETLRELVEQSRRSASVYDALAKPITVSVDVVTG